MVPVKRIFFVRKSLFLTVYNYIVSYVLDVE